MYNHTLIAYEENNDGGMETFPAPMMPTGTQLPALPEVEPPSYPPPPVEYNTQDNTFLIFGLILAAIIILSAILILMKKRQPEEIPVVQTTEQEPRKKPKITVQKTEKEKIEKEEVKEEEIDENTPLPQPQTIVRQQKNPRAKLSTPTNISQCIRKFLENTK